MAKQVFVIFHRVKYEVDSEWHKLPHFFSSKKKAEEWLQPGLIHRDESYDDHEHHIQGYDLDPEPVQYY